MQNIIRTLWKSILKGFVFSPELKRFRSKRNRFSAFVLILNTNTYCIVDTSNLWGTVIKAREKQWLQFRKTFTISHHINIHYIFHHVLIHFHNTSYALPLHECFFFYKRISLVKTTDLIHSANDLIKKSLKNLEWIVCNAKHVWQTANCDLE